MTRFGKTAATSAALSALFLVCYTGSNWITGRRLNVGSYYFAWERHIPFVPAMILPYMSIDLFFIAAPFMARSDHERRTIAGRIAMAIILACACFLLLPLKFAFERPHVDGPLGLIFNNFRSLDLPFNQAPSLHIALLLILLEPYFHRSKGVLRWILVGWFALIGFSALLTYQHHIVDILGGVALAGLCFHFIADRPLRQPFVPNHRVALYYAAGAAFLTALAFARMPWTALILLPTFSLAVVAAGYLLLGPGIYRKQDGKHPLTTTLLLWPVLIGQRLSLAHYANRCDSYNVLTDRLWIGRRLSADEAREAQIAGVTAVVDLTAELSEHSPFRDLAYLPLAMLDLTAPTAAQLEQAIDFIMRHANAGIVYLHCKAGYSRTAAVAGAYLLASGNVQTVEEALARMIQARPSLVVRAEALAALEAFDARRRDRRELSTAAGACSQGHLASE